MPRLALELADRDGSHWRALDGSMLSADISGFTALSERLAGKGKAGAEEITILINTCFTALIDAAYGYRGEVIKFGGDALLVLFRGDDHERRSANAALAMQAALVGSGAARRANLTMTVGVGHGPFDAFLVGDTHRELLLIGDAASEVIHLEGEADKGQTLVTPHIAELLPTALIGVERAGGRAISGRAFLTPGPMESRPDAVRDLARFVPPPVVRQLAAFADLGGEHRLVTVGFLLVTGIGAAIAERGPDEVGQHLGRLIDGVGAAVEGYGGTALHTDIAPDGFKVVLCAGAPVSEGNTSDAMVRAALDIAALDTPFTLRQGIQTGRAFAGFLGSPYRRTYTLMGDVVNTAARMLGKADHREVVAVADVLADTRDRYLTEPIEPFLVKGKREPMVAHHVTGLDRGGAVINRDGPLLGRDDERSTVGRVLSNPGRVLDITGPPGAGKSRLVTDAVESTAAAATGATVIRGASPRFGRGRPYGTASLLLRTAVGVDPMADALHSGDMLTKLVAERCPELGPMLPLLALAFGADVAPTPEADAIGDDFRRPRMHDTVVALLEAFLPGPLALVVEDVQWVDDGSRALLEHLAAQTSERPWSVVFTRRPDGADLDLDLDLDHVDRLELGPLSDTTIRRLAIERSEAALSDTDLALVVERAAGNPLFAIELTRAVAAGDSAVPDTVETLLATRIDRLPPDARRAVRLAAVIGPRFTSEAVTAVAGRAVAASIADPALAGIIEGDGDTWSFAQSLYRDAAYEGLPFARRRLLHRRVGEHLERRAAPRVDEEAQILSVHFSRARSHAKAWAYSVMAGDRAMERSAPVEAAEAYRRALEAGRWTRSITRRQRCTIATRLGDAAERAGDYADAADAYRMARRLLAADDGDRLPLFRKQGVLLERQGRYDQAVRWYERGLTAADELDHDHADERSELILAIAGIRFRQGRYDDCWDTASSVAAELTAPTKARFRAHYLLQLTGVYQRRAETAVHAEQAQGLAPAVEDAVLQSNLYNNLGIAAYYAGDWDQAAELYQRSYELRSAAGDLSGTVSSLSNIGEVRSDQGRLDEARELFEEAHRRARAAGYDLAVHVTRLNLGRLAGRRGARDDARRLLSEARAAFEAIDSANFVAEADLRLLELEDPGPALADGAARLLAGAEAAGGAVNIEIPARRLRATALVVMDRSTEAVSEIGRAVAAARDGQLDHELLLSLEVEAEVAAATGDPETATAARAEARALRHRLGVIA